MNEKMVHSSKGTFNASRGIDVSVSFLDLGPKAAGLTLEVAGIFVGVLTVEIITDDGKEYGPFRSFETSSGHVLMSVDFAQHGDQLWVLAGARSPFVLRVQGNAYQLISEATVFSKDDRAASIHVGGIVDELEARKNVIEQIYIV